LTHGGNGELANEVPGYVKILAKPFRLLVTIKVWTTQNVKEQDDPGITETLKDN